MCNNNGDPFIATIHNVLLAPDLCDRLFSIVTSMNLGTYLFIPQRFLNGVIWSKRKNAVTLPHIAQRKHAFLGKIKEMSKTKK